MAEALRDRFANIATFKVTMSAANTITFFEVRTNAGIDSSRKKATAILVDQIDYFPGTAAVNEMTATTDHIEMAITLSDSVTDLTDMDDTNILNAVQLLRHDFGTAASGQLIVLPLEKQFFPALIHAEKRMFLGMASGGLASAGVGRARVYYRTVELTEGEFIEIAEVFRLVG